MVKAYLRYDETSSWGVIASNSDACYTRDGRHLVTAALEDVCIWDVKTATVVKRLKVPHNQAGNAVAEVVHLAASPATDQLAVGHADGVVRVWNLEGYELEATFAGHRTGVASLCWSDDGATLASGGRDTDVVLWDVGAEAGLARLRGHTGEVTALAFLPAANALASASKDGRVRVWDLSVQRCRQTLTLPTGEIWALAKDGSGQRLAVAGADDSIHWYAVAGSGDLATRDGPVSDGPSAGPATDELLRPMGSVRRAAPDRPTALVFAAPDTLVCTSAGRVVDMYRVRTEDEAVRHAKRRRRRRREKQTKAGAKRAKTEVGDAPLAQREWLENLTAGDDADVDASGAVDVEDDGLQAQDELETLPTLRSKHRVRAVAPGLRRRGRLTAVLALANNSLEVWELAVGADAAAGGADAESPHTRLAVIDGPGHRGDVRAMALATDDSLAVSASGSGVKVWNPRSGACLRTIEAGYGTSLLFAPGNRHAVLGSKNGTLTVMDLAAGVTLSVVEAHAGTIWSLAALPDGTGFVSGSGDKEVKEWAWTLETDPEEAARDDGQPPKPRLGIKHTRTMQMTDDVMSVRISPNGKLLAVALLDATVRIFFLDTFKFFLSLYGHKLPVLCMDISSDSTLLVTGSADKNLKIWGLDFGDCHRSLFAHDDSVMQAAFVPGTHYVFTGGKDGRVKYWDADKFEQLLTLEGHHGAVWALAVSSLGDWLLTGSADRSLRRWDKTDEPFFVEEEKERRLESLFEADLARQQEQPLVPGAEGAAPAVLGEEGASAPAARRTQESVSAADSVVEALDAAAAEERALEEWRAAGDLDAPAPAPNPLLLGATPSEHVLAAVRRVRGPELESAALLLPYGDALSLLRYATGWLAGPAAGGPALETVARLVLLLARLHLSQLTVAPAARGTLARLRDLLHARLTEAREAMGFNLAGLGVLASMTAERSQAKAAAIRPTLA